MHTNVKRTHMRARACISMDIGNNVSRSENSTPSPHFCHNGFIAILLVVFFKLEEHALCAAAFACALRPQAVFA